MKLAAKAKPAAKKAIREALPPQIARLSKAAPAAPFKLGERVRAIRLDANLTLAEVAERADLARSTLSKIENGRHSVRATTLRAVQDALERLGVDVTQNGRTGHHAVGTSYA